MTTMMEQDFCRKRGASLAAFMRTRQQHDRRRSIICFYNLVLIFMLVVCGDEPDKDTQISHVGAKIRVLRGL